MTKIKNILRILAIILIVLVSVFALTGCGKKDKNKDANQEDYQEPIRNYLDGIRDKNIEKILSAFPDFMDMSKNITMTEVDEFYEYYESQYGGNIKISYEFGNAVRLGEDELSELEGEIKSTYSNVENIENVDLTDGYTVKYKITVKGDGVENTVENEEDELSSSETKDEETYVIKYNGKWYRL